LVIKFPLQSFLGFNEIVVELQIITDRGIYPFPFLMEIKVGYKISTAKKAKKNY